MPPPDRPVVSFACSLEGVTSVFSASEVAFLPLFWVFRAAYSAEKCPVLPFPLICLLADLRLAETGGVTRIESHTLHVSLRSATRITEELSPRVYQSHNLTTCSGTIELTATTCTMLLAGINGEVAGLLGVIFSKKWPHLRGITWPLAKTKSYVIASIQCSKLKHKAPQVRFTHYNVAASFLLRELLFWTSCLRLSGQHMDKCGQLMALPQAR